MKKTLESDDNDVSDLFTGTSAGYAANRLARAFTLAASRQLSEHGISPGQLPALLQLSETDLNQAELARRTGVEQPTMANTLRRMERDGLIHRTPDPTDGRRALIQLTERTRSLLPTIREQLDTINDIALHGLSPHDRALLVGAIYTAGDNLIAFLTAEDSTRDTR